MNKAESTICAISTPVGRGAISLIRVSGEASFSIVSSIFKSEVDLENDDGGSILHGWIIDPENDELIDEVILFTYRKPHSYTGEDMIEISTHGGIVIPRRVLNLLLKYGLKYAEPGEFTRRAFLNNKMSLLEAEALLNVVEAKTERGVKIAEDNLKGKLQKEIDRLKEGLIEVKSIVETIIDFEESEDILVDREDIVKNIENISKSLSSLLLSYRGGKILIDGIQFAIVGRPNVGKSSLFNTILQEDRAIVTSEPGTTRDILEGTVDIDGYPVKFMDMAGFRVPLNEPERVGVERAGMMIDKADGIILVFDVSESITDKDKEIFGNISGKPIINVVNKCDLPWKFKKLPFPGTTIFVSAKEHTGIGELNGVIIKMIEELLPDGFSENPICTTERQKRGVEYVKDLLKGTLEVIKAGDDIELVAFDLQESIDRLKELTGEITEENILDRIFEKFCIGK